MEDWNVERVSILCDWPLSVPSQRGASTEALISRVHFSIQSHSTPSKIFMVQDIYGNVFSIHPIFQGEVFEISEEWYRIFS